MSEKETQGSKAKMGLPAKTEIHLWSQNFLSNWFFVWVYPIISKGSLENIANLTFILRKQESAQVNVDLLDKAYQKELRENAS